MKLIVGLGNPTAEYAETFHNVGFKALDNFASRQGLQFKTETKFKGQLAEVVIDGHKALLLKPLTYMNLSGESVRKVVEYYKINLEDILVVADDLDSTLGRLRLKSGGSSGGHNGHRNIISNLKTEKYKRLKIGIGRSETVPVIEWVLSKPNAKDKEILDLAIEKSYPILVDFILDVPFHQLASRYCTK